MLHSRNWLLLVGGALMALFLVLTVLETHAAEPQVYVEIIVKACPADPRPPLPPCKPDQCVLGWYVDPQGQGEGEEARQHSKSKAERNAYWAKIGCIATCQSRPR